MDTLPDRRVEKPSTSTGVTCTPSICEHDAKRTEGSGPEASLESCSPLGSPPFSPCPWVTLLCYERSPQSDPPGQPGNKLFLWLRSCMAKADSEEEHLPPTLCTTENTPPTYTTQSHTILTPYTQTHTNLYYYICVVC